jgi:hypothetical protein
MVLMHSFLLLQSECCFFLCTRESTSHLYDTLIYGCRSLGLLNFIRLWHDNSGSGSSASWFLKCIIVQDLQTMERTYFIAQRWFAVEEDDGRVCVRCFRSNVYCLWLVVRREREKHSRISSPRKSIIAFQKGTCGFPSFLDHLPMSLHAFNVVPVVSYSYSFRCF